MWRRAVGSLAVLLLWCQPALAVSLLWNPGPTRRAFIHWDDPLQYCNPNVSSLSEGHLDGNPVNGCSAGFNCSGQTIISQDGSCYSVLYLTRNWPESQRGVYWNIWSTGGWGGNMVITHRNLAKNAPDPCLQREITTDLRHYPPNNGRWSFKEDYQLGDFNQIIGKMDAPVQYETPGSNCASDPKKFGLIELGVQYLNGSSVLRTDAVSIVIYNPNGVDYLPNDPALIWKSPACTSGGSLCQIVFNGAYFGLPVLSGSFKSYSVDFKPYFQNYFPAPPGGQSVNDAHIYFFEPGRSSVKGADLSTEIQNLDVVGQ